MPRMERRDARYEQDRRAVALALALSIVPGLGHLRLGRYGQGVAFFALFAAAANGVLIGSFWQGEETAWWIRIASGALAALVFAVSTASIVKLSLLTDRAALARERDEALRRALVHYLRDELRDARRELERALRCDVDRRDADVLFHLGVVTKRLGEGRRARRHFAACLACDPTGKWRYEVETELARPAPPPASAPAPAAGAATVARGGSGPAPAIAEAPT